jgi:large subunit ribosomal protein L15
VKLHDLRPASGARQARTRVGRGIAAGKGKTAGRGTKGQKARAGASIPAWFEGGQTPIHIRVPKLHGFRNRFKVAYQVVNVGQISAYAATGRFGVEAPAAKSGAGKKSGDQPVTVNAEVLANAGLVRSADKPVKVLGEGEVGHKLFVAADAFSASARRKIEAAGGFVQVLAPEPVAAAAEPAAAAAEPAAEEAQPVAQAEAVAVDTKPDTTIDDGGSQATEDAPTEEASAAAAPAPEASAKPARKRAAKKPEQA